MIDKSLVKKRFKKSLKTYEDNAIVQKQMAKNLIDLLPSKGYSSILEIGCATGTLTKEIVKNINYETFTANDIVEDSKKYIKRIIPESEFLAGDIEAVEILDKYDLIISNACLQWCCDIEKTISKLMNHLKKDGILAISIFGEDNLKEIKSFFDIKNTNVNINSLNLIKQKEEIIKLYFNNPIDVLKHIKLTGANALKEQRLTKKVLKNFEDNYVQNYSENDNVYLTYNPLYYLFSRKS